MKSNTTERSIKLKMTIKCRGGSLCPPENILKTNGRGWNHSPTKDERRCLIAPSRFIFSKHREPYPTSFLYSPKLPEAYCCCGSHI